MKITLLVLLCLFLAAQAAPPPGFTPDDTQWFPCSMVRYSTPLKLSAVLGVTLMNLEPFGNYHGFCAQIEPGFGGGKINAGYRLGKHHFVPVYNIGLNLSLLQTWGNPLGEVESGQTYAGIEVAGAVLMFGVNCGVFRHIAGDSADWQWINTIGVSVGI